MRGAIARWRVALRIARRSALRSRARSLLVVLLIAVPIAGLTAGAVLLPSTQSTREERIANTLGHAQARLQVLGSPGDHVRQGVEGGYDYVVDPKGDADGRRIDPRRVLPAGTRVLRIGGGAAVFRTPGGSASLQVVTGPSWDPSLDGGPYALLSGRRPEARDEVLVSPAALVRLGARVGGTIESRSPRERRLTVVGTARDRAQPTAAQTVFGAASLAPDPDATPDVFSWYVPTAAVDWATVRRLNAAGTTVFSRAVLARPPVLPADLDFSHRTFGFTLAATAVIIVAVAFAVLEVALLAGAAFLVSARLQQRSLATVASVGADRGVLRRIVAASGVVLGAVGGLVGVALGIGGGLLVIRLTDDGSWTRYPGVHLLWPLLIGIALLGVLVGWLAAAVPARAASRFDVVRALRGARPPRPVGRRRPIVGVALLGLGIAATLLGGALLVAALRISGEEGTAPQLAALALLSGGPVLAQLGVLLCAGLLLRGIARLLTRAPLPARLAARDTSRNLGRAVPAVASVMTTVFLASFAMCIANTSSEQAAVGYSWSTATPGGAAVDIAWNGDATPTRADAAAQLRVLRGSLPIRSAALTSTTFQTTSGTTPSDRSRDALPQVRFPDPPACGLHARRNAEDLRCGPFTANGGGGINALNDVTVGTRTRSPWCSAAHRPQPRSGRCGTAARSPCAATSPARARRRSTGSRRSS